MIRKTLLFVTALLALFCAILIVLNSLLLVSIGSVKREITQVGISDEENRALLLQQSTEYMDRMTERFRVASEEAESTYRKIVLRVEETQTKHEALMKEKLDRLDDVLAQYECNGTKAPALPPTRKAIP